MGAVARTRSLDSHGHVPGVAGLGEGLHIPSPFRLIEIGGQKPNLRAGEAVPSPVLRFLADQVHAPATAFAEYARRNQTRLEHAGKLQQRLGLRPFARADIRHAVESAAGAAWTTDKGGPIAERKYQASGREVAQFMRPFSWVIEAVDQARAEGGDAIDRIDAQVGWAKLFDAKPKVDALAALAGVDPLVNAADRAAPRRFATTFLEQVRSKVGTGGAPLLKTLAIPRDLNRTGRREVPADAPLPFASTRWKQLRSTMPNPSPETGAMAQPRGPTVRSSGLAAGAAARARSTPNMGRSPACGFILTFQKCTAHSIRGRSRPRRRRRRTFLMD